MRSIAAGDVRLTKSERIKKDKMLKMFMQIGWRTLMQCARHQNGRNFGSVGTSMYRISDVNHGPVINLSMTIVAYVTFVTTSATICTFKVSITTCEWIAYPLESISKTEMELWDVYSSPQFCIVLTRYELLYIQNPSYRETMENYGKLSSTIQNCASCHSYLQYPQFTSNLVLLMLVAIYTYWSIIHF